jgi:hypothetical protein
MWPTAPDDHAVKHSVPIQENGAWHYFMFSHLVSATFPMSCRSFRSIDLPTALNPQTFRDVAKLFLQPGFPAPRMTAAMYHCNDRHKIRENSINHQVRKSRQKRHPSLTVDRWKNRWLPRNKRRGFG